MANLIGSIHGNRGSARRTSHETIDAVLETWNGAIKTTLHADGTFAVQIGQKGTPNGEIVRGNVNDGERTAMGNGRLLSGWYPS